MSHAPRSRAAKGGRPSVKRKSNRNALVDPKRALAARPQTELAGLSKRQTHWGLVELAGQSKNPRRRRQKRHHELQFFRDGVDEASETDNCAGEAKNAGSENAIWRHYPQRQRQDTEPAPPLAHSTGGFCRRRPARDGQPGGRMPHSSSEQAYERSS